MDNSKIYSKIIYSYSAHEDLQEWLSRYEPGKVFIATEEHVDRLWGNAFSAIPEYHNIHKMVVPSGEHNKSLESVRRIWDFLSQNGADRKSLLINIGGGMLTDLAGFAASTFKRGIDFINIPTTLLSQVDASVGGKTGFNFNGLKNEIGVFNDPLAVIIDTKFLSTLDHRNFLSGFAEMIKHGMIKNPDHLEDLKNFDFNNINYKNLHSIIQDSVHVKEYFVLNDPTEKNIRKALNFGHTAGHAFESLALEQNRPVLHGYAVAWGMAVELFLSAEMCELEKADMEKLNRWLLGIYGKFEINPDDFPRLLNLMTHDKKNESGRINFTLLSAPGKVRINQDCRQDAILRALHYYNAL